MKANKTISPQRKQMLKQLEEVVQRVGYKMIYEKGNFKGGYCLLKDTRLFVINSRYDIDKKISIICKNLKEIGIDGIYIKPFLREIIESDGALLPLNKIEKTKDEAES